MTQQREAAAAHRVAVLAEEFVVERIRNRAPQAAVLRGRDAGKRRRKRGGLDAGLLQQHGARNPAALSATQRFFDEIDRYGSAFAALAARRSERGRRRVERCRLVFLRRLAMLFFRSWGSH